jgi:hypothetical protein
LPPSSSEAQPILPNHHVRPRYLVFPPVIRAPEIDGHVAIGIVDWLRSAGILSHSKIMTLRDAFVVAACVFLAGIAAIVLSRTLWKRFVRVTVRTLLERTTRLDAARIPLLR